MLVELRGRGPAVVLTGDLEKVVGKCAILFEKCLGNLIKVQIVVSSLDFGHNVELGRGQFEQGDLHVVSAACPRNLRVPHQGNRWASKVAYGM